MTSDDGGSGETVTGDDSEPGDSSGHLVCDDGQPIDEDPSDWMPKHRLRQQLQQHMQQNTDEFHSWLKCF